MSSLEGFATNSYGFTCVQPSICASAWQALSMYLHKGSCYAKTTVVAIRGTYVLLVKRCHESTNKYL